ncbi:unnamed protein product, partial [Ectocarpus sp. 12 AP-2014]
GEGTGGGGGAVIHQTGRLCPCACFELETLVLKFLVVLLQTQNLVLIRNQIWFGVAGVPSPQKNKL